MKKEKMEKIIAKAVSAHTDDAPADVNAVLVELITAGATNATTALNMIKKAFKEAGIIKTASVSALSEVRDYLAVSMPDMNRYADVHVHAAAMQEKFSVNDDDEKGIKSCVKLIKEQLKEDSLPIPRKIQLQAISALRVEYFNDPENEPESIEGLAEYLIDNIDVDESVMTEEFQKKLKITAGTDFSVNYMIKHGLTLEEMNGEA